MWTALMRAILAVALLVLLQAGTGGASLEARRDAWPHWRLPAPLERPGRSDLTYPDWFEGSWELSGEDGLALTVRFRREGEGAVHGDRAFNARAFAAAAMGDALLGVENDPANPNRQIARFRGPDGRRYTLESTVTARRTARPGPDRFLADELSLQVLHGPGAPRLSQVETLSGFKRRADGSIDAVQWQAVYPSPAEALRSEPVSTSRHRLQLRPQPAPGS